MIYYDPDAGVAQAVGACAVGGALGGPIGCVAFGAAALYATYAAIDETVNALNRDGDANDDSNVIPFSTRKSATDDQQCSVEDDGCAERAAQLEKLKIQILASAASPKLLGQYRQAALAINDQIDLHNAECPNNYVSHLPLGPSSAP